MLKGLNLEITDIWTAAGVLLGFQITAFSWRISEEERVRANGSIPWIPPADYLNLAAMVLVAVGVFVLPITGLLDARQVTVILGLAIIVFVGYAFAIAGHYEMYNRHKASPVGYFPFQEKVVVGIVILVATVYLALSIWR